MSPLEKMVQDIFTDDKELSELTCKMFIRGLEEMRVLSEVLQIRVLIKPNCLEITKTVTD